MRDVEGTAEERRNAMNTKRWCVRTDDDGDFKYGVPVSACWGDGHICTSCPAAKDHPADPR